MKWISSKSNENGVPVEITDKILDQLRLKHPEAELVEEDLLITEN